MSGNLFYLNTKQNNSQGFQFGLRLSFLPDFLLDHTLLGKEPSERIAEHTKRWNQFVSGLWRDSQDVTYALRFDADRTNKSIETYILGRLRCEHKTNAATQAEILLRDLARMFKAFGFEPRLLTTEELKSLLENYRYQNVFQVCQEEVTTPIRKEIPIDRNTSHNSQKQLSIPREFIYPQTSPPRIYGIRPWWGAGGTFLIPFNAIASQNSAVSVCILLAPTCLYPQEQTLIAEIARETETFASMQAPGKMYEPSHYNQNKIDPQLRWESKLYAANLRRLTHPFLAGIFCFSDDVATAQQVASAFASTIREETAYDPPLGETETIPSGAKVIPSNNPCKELIACQTLDFTHIFSKDCPNPKLQRLRYLIDGRGAASAFRFPISVQGGVAGIAVKQRPPDFHPGSRNEKIPQNAIDLGRFHVGGRAYVTKNAFTKHALITGFTGSGKSNTSLYLLDQFYRKFQIPFLVIESAKKEYRGLRNVNVFQDKLRIYTLGNENVAPLRFNPFELIPGVRVESHLANLQTCFEGALPPVGPLPSIIAESIETIYGRYGWRLTDYGTTPEEKFRKFPSMEDFYTEVERVVRQRGYQGETKSNLEAAIKGRIKPLLMGSKGKMFSSRLSCPSAETLFNHPVILELNDLNEEDKSLVMMFFLTLLREYRELNTSKELIHITLVEEAHNVLGNVSQNKSEDSSDVKAKSVQAFCNMLAEVRAYGEGLIITDQSPEKLARDAMRNTNVQIAHQLRDAHDREAIANAMIMSEEQRDYLGKCETGRAAVFYTGLQKATFIDVPVYKDKLSSSNFEDFWRGFRDNLSPRLSDEEVREYMTQFDNINQKKDVSCSLCRHQCDLRMFILGWAESGKDEFKKALAYFDSASSKETTKAWTNLVEAVLKITDISDSENLDIGWCFLKEMWFRYKDNVLKEDDKESYIDVSKKILYGNNK